MSNRLPNLFMKNKVLLSIIVIIIVGGISGIIFWSKKSAPSELFTVQRGTLVQGVSATGKVEFPTKIDLRFKNSGTFAAVHTGIGQEVQAGQLLASQDTSELDAQVLEMKAGIELQQAKLDQLLSGASNENIKLAEIKLENAKRKLYSDDLIATSKDEARRDVVPTITGIYDGTQEGSYEIFFKDYNDLFNRRNASFRGLEEGVAEKDDLPQKFGTKGLFISFPEVNYRADDRWLVDIPNKSGVNYAANLNAYNSAQAELALTKASIRSSDIAVYKAQISQAEASLEKIEAQRSELMIFTPVSGAVIEVNGEIGENIGPDTVVVSVAVGDTLQIKLNIIEDKIVDVSLGQEAEITFDAIENQKFYGRIISINPAETEVEGAIYYETTVTFDEVDERIKSGMTANVFVKTAVKENTLYIPISAVQIKDNTKSVQILENNKIISREVTTGTKDSTGRIEIINGLQEGDQVIVSLPKSE